MIFSHKKFKFCNYLFTLCCLFKFSHHITFFYFLPFEPVEVTNVVDLAVDDSVDFVAEEAEIVVVGVDVDVVEVVVFVVVVVVVVEIIVVVIDVVVVVNMKVVYIDMKEEVNVEFVVVNLELDVDDIDVVEVV